MTLVYFLIILGAIVFVHESGHFLLAKAFGIYVHEFSLGMGPRIFKFNRKNDPTEYSIRLFPIGGYVSIAGEDDFNTQKEVPKEQTLTSKPWLQRLIVMASGAIFNFIFTLILIFFLALKFGHVQTEPYIGEALVDYPAYEAGIEKGDLILSIDGDNISSYDELLIHLFEANGEETLFEVLKTNGDKIYYDITPVLEGDTYKYGIKQSLEKDYGVIKSIQYTFKKFVALVDTMVITITDLFKGTLTINQFSGPVGVYSLIGDNISSSAADLIYLAAYLSLNIGFINLLPLPALDGGKIFFLILEKILGKPVDRKKEAAIHYIGFILLMILMLYITFNDLFKLGG